jgi:hypothetical protein
MFKEANIVNCNRFALLFLMNMNQESVHRLICRQVDSLHDCIIMQFLRFMLKWTLNLGQVFKWDTV